MRALILLCLTLIAASPAHAELRDVRARMSGQEGLVWLAFDGQPVMLRSELSASGVELFIEGVSVSTHQITPRDRDIVTALQVEQTETGARISLQGSRPWTDVEAELRQGGVLVSIRFAAGELPASHAASAYPAADPAWTPTPVPPAGANTVPEHAPAHLPDHVPDHASAPDPAAHPAEPDSHAAPTAAPVAAAEPETPHEGPARASTVPAQAAAMAEAALPADVTACAAAAAAVEADPWDDARLMQHAACLGRAGDAGQASRIYEQMLAFEPENVTATLALADLRLQQGDRAAARTLYLRAAEHATTDAQAMRARGQAEALRPQ